MRRIPHLQLLSRALISLFIVVHVFTIVAWSMPASNLMIQAYSDLVHPFMTWSGLWQGWSMFAPNPRATNAEVDAVIHFRNGEVRTWVFPRIDLEGVTERPYFERWNQWEVTLGNPHDAVIRKDAARFVARLHRNPKNPPVLVQLRRHWSPVPPPVPGDYQPLTRDLRYEHHEVLVTYKVEESDLQ